MCKVTEQGYQLKCSDRIITSADLDTLTHEEMQELLLAPVTAWEMLHLRKQNHHIINQLSAHIMEENLEFEDIKDSLSSIKNSLVVKVKNGTETEHSIGELLVDLYNGHKGDRRRTRLYGVLKEYKISVLVIALALVGMSIYHHKVIDALLMQVEGYILPILGAGIVAPLLVILITNLFRKS